MALSGSRSVNVNLYNDLQMNTHGNAQPFPGVQIIEAFLDAAPDAMIITGEDGMIRFVNLQTLHPFGYTRNELIGQPIDELLTRVKKQHAVEIKVNPLQLPDGKYLLTTIRDITGYKQREEQLERELRSKTEELSKSRNIYRTIASSIPGSVIVLFDRDYRYLLIEGDLMQRMGYDQQKLLHQKAADVLPPHIFEGAKICIDRVFAGEYFMTETQVIGLDVVTRYVPIRSDGNISMAMVVVIDITELKQSQRALAALNASLEQKVKDRTEQLTQVNTELESFTYSVSHDLRAPLRIIDGFADIMLADFSENLDEDGKRSLQIIKTNARRMGQLIDDLLNFSRMGRKELVITPVNMQAVVEEVLEEQRLLFHKPVAIQLDPLPPAHCDKPLMRQVWTNLVSNALKYASKRALPAVHISSIEQDNQVVYTIKDNGVGFDMQYANKLFGVFQRLHKHNEYEGTGVGLALVHKIITRHGGDIWADAAVDKGAIFHFSLPAQQ
jgi:PAS domain S-box-containing protein